MQESLEGGLSAGDSEQSATTKLAEQHSPREDAAVGVDRPPPHRRWVSRDDAIAVYGSQWGSHRCRDCPCFRCVTLRWAMKPKCTCRRRNRSAKPPLGLDDAIRTQRLQCRCRPPSQVWGTLWCVCDLSPQWSRTGDWSFLIGEDETRLPEATLEGSSSSDVEQDSPPSRQRRRIIL
jgi:hypothetical protein